MVKDAEKFKEEDAKRQKLEMTKMSIENVSDETQNQLNQFRDRLPAETIERIEKAIEVLEGLKNKGITFAEIESAEKAVEEAKTAVLQIGINLNKQSGGEEKK